jgi:hypothetical protein
MLSNRDKALSNSAIKCKAKTNVQYIKSKTTKQQK